VAPRPNNYAIRLDGQTNKYEIDHTQLLDQQIHNSRDLSQSDLQSQVQEEEETETNMEGTTPVNINTASTGTILMSDFRNLHTIMSIGDNYPEP
jgi:hypothetical protein